MCVKGLWDSAGDSMGGAGACVSLSNWVGGPFWFVVIVVQSLIFHQFQTNCSISGARVFFVM